ncbi:unnamed protein product [Rhodiola kirilowii]
MMRKIKVQPIQSPVAEFDRADPPKPPPTRSRFVRLIPSVLLRTSSSEKVCPTEEVQSVREGFGDFEPSSVWLANMVQNFMEENSNNNEEKMQHISIRCGRRRCKCFNGVDDSSDDEPDCFGGCFGESNASSAVEACDNLKSLVPCSSVVERKLLADTAKIVERNTISKQKAKGCLEFVTDGLVSLGYDASICQSRWEKTPSYPAGEYEYIDVVHEGERLLVDIDFRSEFEIARPTKTYKAILQTLPVIFVGKPDGLEGIISTMTDAAKQSLKKKGLHFPPWRKAEYVKSKWLAPYTRISPTLKPPSATKSNPNPELLKSYSKTCSPITPTDSELPTAEEDQDHELVFPFPEDDYDTTTSSATMEGVAKEWSPTPPCMKPKTGVRVVTGLASIMKE